MSQAGEIVISKSKVENFKIGKIVYFELIMAILNTILIIYLFTLARNITVFSILFAFIFLGILYGGLFTAFLKRNPFYKYFLYGIILCGILGNVYDVVFSPVLGIIFVPQFYYIYGKVSELYIDPYENFFAGKTQKQILAEKQRQEINRKRRREEKKKFNGILIEYLSLGCSIGLLFTMIFSA